ncbi:MAG: CRISPR-associated endonuclease Cas2 [Rickettsiales bacterium]|nr:CRISPR-associated endonuclease Cas2 [Rickettsiales bacterium]
MADDRSRERFYFKCDALKYMWMMVMFDLPTDTAHERKQAAKFRKFLLDAGFEMSQYSVYFRFTGTRENSQKYVEMVEDHNPGTGDISILFYKNLTANLPIFFIPKTAPSPLSWGLFRVTL